MSSCKTAADTVSHFNWAVGTCRVQRAFMLAISAFVLCCARGNPVHHHLHTRFSCAKVVPGMLVKSRRLKAFWQLTDAAMLVTCQLGQWMSARRQEEL